MSAKMSEGLGSAISKFPILHEEASPEEVASYLQESGIPEEYTTAFVENFIDGEEFRSLSDDNVAKMVKPIGLVKKISRLIRKISPDCPTTSSANQPTNTLPIPPTEIAPDGEEDSHTTEFQAFQIPEQWSEGTMECLSKQVVTPTARKEIVQTLATMLRARQQRPSTDMCREAAERLVLKYPFMQDPFGKRYTSWLQKISEHLNNKRKYQSRRTKDTNPALPPSKRARVAHTSSRIHRYPVLQDNQQTDDEDAMVRHLREAKKEMQRAKPRDDILLQLMRSTFQYRRDRIASGTSQSIQEVLEQFPALKRRAVVEQDMELIMQQKGIAQKAAKGWRDIWMPAVIELGENSRKPSVQSLLAEYETDETDGDKDVLHALKMLVALYLPKAKKIEDTLIHLYEEYEMSTTMEEAAVKEPRRASPRIAAFTRDNAKQYFLFVEQDIIFL